jgi:hypothetical protein
MAPTAEEAPNSSLAHMLDLIRTRLCGDGGAYGTADGLDTGRAIDALWRAVGEQMPVFITTTSFALVHLLDALAERDLRLPLPEGSRIMDTGGYKGRARAHSRAALARRIEYRLDIPASMFENEYGMSELSSQWYLGTIAQTIGEPLPSMEGAAPEARWAPPWVRTLVVNPATLQEVNVGDIGVLAHCDLSNVWSCAFVRTDDAGLRLNDGRFRLLGRAPGSVPRGCSLPYEALT